MTESEIDVWVMDGGIRVQRWVCTRNPMPDGSPGVLWRGRVYPLLPDDCIEIGQIPDRPPHHAVLAGEEASWVLIQGLPAALDAASLALEQGGIVIARSG